MILNLKMKLFMVAASVAVAMLFVEIGLRVANVSFPGAAFYEWDGRNVSPPSLYTWDDDLGTMHRPGFQGWFRSEGIGWVSINSQGLRDREHSKAKPPNTVRIAVLGDSMIQALQVPFEKSFCPLLERDLTGCAALGGKTVEVINFAVGGYSTAQELIMLRKRVWDYDPDIVILAFFIGNDVLENLRALVRDPYRPYFVHRDGKLVLDDSFRRDPNFHARLRLSVSQRFLYWAMRHSRLVQSVHQASLHLSDWHGGGAQAGLSPAIFAPPPDPDWREAWSVSEDLILAMRGEVQARGAKFVVMLPTRYEQVHPDVAFREAEMQRDQVSSLDYPNQRLMAFGQRNSIPVVNLVPALGQYSEENHVYLHGFWVTHNLGTGHWNENGHRLAAQVTADDLCSSVLPATRTESIPKAEHARASY